MRYTYRCPEHGEFTSETRADRDCCPVEERHLHFGKRIWSFRADTDFQPYYSPSFGQVINSRQHAKTLAKIQNEEHFAKWGVEAHYEVVETHDDAAFNLDTEEKKHYGEETERRKVNSKEWVAKRDAELQAERDKKRAEKDAKESVDA